MYTVVVDSPFMARRHDLTVKADNATDARREAARQAILADRLGSGNLPDDAIATIYSMPAALRESQSVDSACLDLVAAYAIAEVA